MHSVIKNHPLSRGKYSTKRGARTTINEESTIKELLLAAKNLKLWVDRINEACGQMNEADLAALKELLRETEKE